MNQLSPPSSLGLIPESAPFSAEQRAWLNGFFAAVITPDNAGVTALSPEQGAAVMQGSSGDGDDGEAPWHDQTMPMAERELAEGRPLRRRAMAAMAQQVAAGAANCHDYSELIVSKAEGRLNPACRVAGNRADAQILHGGRRTPAKRLQLRRRRPAGSVGDRTGPVA